MQTNVAVDRHELETEPALTIGQIFADKKMLKTYVAAGASLVALAFKVAIDDAQVDNIVTVLSGLGVLVTAIMAQLEASQRARAQAQETRGHVYAPATVERIRAEAAPYAIPDAQPRSFVSHGPGVRPREGIQRTTNPGS